MDQMVNHIVQIPVLQRQFFQLLAQRMDFFGCQLFIDGRGSASTGWRLPLHRLDRGGCDTAPTCLAIHNIPLIPVKFIHPLEPIL